MFVYVCVCSCVCVCVCGSVCVCVCVRVCARFYLPIITRYKTHNDKARVYSGVIVTRDNDIRVTETGTVYWLIICNNVTLLSRIK